MKAWKCPDCDNDTFHEVNEDVTIRTVVTNIFKDPEYGYLEFDYGEQEIEGGEFPETCYICTKCNYTLKDNELENLAS